MRNMSFMLTHEQIRNRTKDVTRRLGWRNTRVDERIGAVRKAMGLRKGETVERLATIEVVSVRVEPLDAIDQADVVREGFPSWTPAIFVRHFCEAMRCQPDREVTRIEFKYVDEAP